MTSPRNRTEYARRIGTLATLRTTNPQHLGRLIAQRRVRRGRQWLDRHGPRGWHRNLFEPNPGGSRFRAKDCRGSECVLALAFEFAVGAKNAHGELTFAVVEAHLEKELGGNRAGLLGFEIGIPFHKRNPNVTIASEELDRCWEDELRHYHHRWSHILKAVA